MQDTNTPLETQQELKEISTPKGKEVTTDKRKPNRINNSNTEIDLNVSTSLQEEQSWQTYGKHRNDTIR
ncbi:15496_t:CDS:2 [Acaulospora colombiana]|uniref:15496_t:CDS:1 n=1 Tax=Acaulospora colombiana TaxID=27376 RepID=A0ACA9KWI5_9GLOM|nr:15496_t:CDS:2 [Acaulospora colombiana]